MTNKNIVTGLIVSWVVIFACMMSGDEESVLYWLSIIGVWTFMIWGMIRLWKI